MLSFMREQGAGDPSGDPGKGAGRHGSKGSGDTGDQEYLTVAANSRSVRKTTILVVVLVSIGLVCLWLMIRKSQPQAASAGQTDEAQATLDGAISRLTGVSSEMVNRMDQIVKKFYEFSNVFQVHVNELSKNPFEVEVFMKDIKEEVAVSEDAGAQAALIRRQLLKQRASTLQLLSIMQSGTSNACMINDRLLKQGDKIEGFVISRIGRDFVELTWHGDGESGNAGSEIESLKTTLKLAQ